MKISDSEIQEKVSLNFRRSAPREITWNSIPDLPSSPLQRQSEFDWQSAFDELIEQMTTKQSYRIQSMDDVAKKLFDILDQQKSRANQYSDSPIANRLGDGNQTDSQRKSKMLLWLRRVLGR